MVERAADASKKNEVGDNWAGQRHELADLQSLLPSLPLEVVTLKSS